MEKLELEYELRNNGWAYAFISYHQSQILMDVSYLHDTLAELAEASLSLSKGEISTRVIFMSEPGEHQLLLNRQSGDKIDFEIRWFEEWESSGICPPDKYEVRLKGSTTSWDFREQVLNVLSSILDEFGTEKYKEMWVEHDFPLNIYEQLRKHNQADAPA